MPNSRSQLIADKIKAHRITGGVVEETLSTSERILARVTDGIYRQPSSALRELIANAYDADATEVTILTDAPRFEKIIVRDNGLGLKAEVLAHVIQSIGGSAKRTHDGLSLGITAVGDPLHAPSGREFIGKIGIGLFSVAQLTSHFQIITKVKGENFRTIADIILHTHSEDHLGEDVERSEFRTGSVKIWSVETSDVDTQGTEIVLMKIKNSAKEALQSREKWIAVENGQEDDGFEHTVIEEPEFHIGCNFFANGIHVVKKSRLPWENSDDPSEKFRKLVDAMADELDGRSNPKIETILDNYLSTIWTLSLAAPLNYIDEHPFSLSGATEMSLYEISNTPKGRPEPIDLGRNETLWERLKLTAGKGDVPLPFTVHIDGIKLKRPIKFKDLPETRNALKTPILMIGSCKPDLSQIPEEYRGGDLSFEAYLFWAPKVVPRDHAGVLLRIHEASGTLFDETFMKYQISEQTRLKQITSEIFVKDGLDSALNIDRESFNYSHPHYQYIKKWLHSALRQLASTQKRLAKEIRDAERQTLVETKKSSIQRAVDDTWGKVKGEDERPPEVVFVARGETQKLRSTANVFFDKEAIFPPNADARKGATQRAADEKFEEQMKALTSVLIAYGVFEEMPKHKQQDLLNAIARIFSVESC